MLEQFEFTPDAHLVTDRRGNIEQANAAAAVLLGVRKEFLVGKPLPFFVAPFALGMGLARRGPLHSRDVLAGVTSTAGAGIAATVTVLWATHRLWGTVLTPHLLAWAVGLAPGLPIAAMMMRAGAAVRSTKTGGATNEGPPPASILEAVEDRT